ncbi:oxygen-independent coproporphyrinogen-3 oxidase [Lachnospiraceae bacterium G41]|nr:oxygen-independent coproporphyrinogen-3 oxidase [Lachnospiraceae bacterium G41]
MDDKEIRSMDKFEKRNTMKRIKVQINKGEREYDVYALLTSFFPGVEVVTAADATGEFEGVFTIKEEGANITISLNFEEIDKAKDFEIKSAEKDAAKKEFGRYLYDFLSECTNKELPWGNLTGIRPTKLIRTMLEEELDSVPGSLCVPGSVIDKIKERAYAERRLRGEKLDLGIDIAKREIEIMSRLHGTDGYSVYVGIPFCPSTCLYCSFTSNPIFKYKDKIKNYLLAIKKELEWDVSHLSDRYLDTIYIGGGTPTTLSPEELDELLGYITNILPMENVREFTIEAGRADSITKEKLDVIKRYPITRISVNPQTMSDKTLKTIGRNHTVKQFVDAFNLVREAGFDNINSDIILGLPGETVEDVKHTMDELIKLGPDSLTVHSLAIKRASRLKRWMDENELEITMDYEEAMRICADGAKAMGLNPYYLYRQKQMAGNLENTGYSKPGKEGLYNILIMEEIQSIVAMGAGSVSKCVHPNGLIERCDNVKDIDLYLNQIDEMIERKQKLFCN